MTDKFSIVDIWAGSFPFKSLYSQYFEEQYIDDDIPINRFAADQGVIFTIMIFVSPSFITIQSHYLIN